jgi:RNA recognition motif-containing protein
MSSVSVKCHCCDALYVSLVWPTACVAHPGSGITLQTSRSRGFAFVTFSSVEAATAALGRMNGTVLDERVRSTFRGSPQKVSPNDSHGVSVHVTEASR